MEEGLTLLRPLWLRKLEKELDPREGIPAVIRRRGALADWEELRSPPSGRAEDELSFAIQIAAADYDQPLVSTCISRSLEVITAGEHDERWSTWWAVTRQGAHGRFLATGEFARAWLSNDDLDRRKLVSASTEALQGAIEERPVWTDLPQCEYVDGVQLLIIAGEIYQAAEKLRIRKKFNRVRRYYDWNVRLLDLLSTQPADLDARREHFDRYFNEIRHPFFHVQPTAADGEVVFGLPLLRLRLALIRWIHIERQPIAGNWRHIIGQIGY